jgi:hypothetical protein
MFLFWYPHSIQPDLVVDTFTNIRQSTRSGYAA